MDSLDTVLLYDGPYDDRYLRLLIDPKSRCYTLYTWRIDNPPPAKHDGEAVMLIPGDWKSPQDVISMFDEQDVTRRSKKSGRSTPSRRRRRSV